MTHNTILNFDFEPVQAIENFLRFLKSHYEIGGHEELANFMKKNGIDGKKIIDQIKSKYNLFNHEELWKFKKEFRDKYVSAYITVAKKIGYNEIDELKQHLPFFFDNFVYDLISPLIDSADKGWGDINHVPIHQKEKYGWN